MRTIYEIRRANLRKLVKRHDDPATGRGGQAALAKAIDKSRAYVNFWLTTNPETGEPRKNMEDTSARDIEDRLGLAHAWMDTDHESQPVGLDVDRMGHALTAIDKVLRARGVRFERQLGKFRSLVTYAYEVQEDKELFPKGVGSENRSRYDRIVDEALAGGLESGAFGKVEMAAIEGAGRTRPRAAKGKKAGSRRT